MSEYITQWHRELEIFRRIQPLLILEGNVLDLFPYSKNGMISGVTQGTPLRLQAYLHNFFLDAGYTGIAFYDRIKGFHSVTEANTASFNTFLKAVKLRENDSALASLFGDDDNSGRLQAARVVGSALSQNESPTAIILNFASRYIASPDNLRKAEIDAYTLLLQEASGSKQVASAKHGLLRNLLVVIVDKLNDLPTWFYLNNPYAKAISLGSPSREERAAFLESNFHSFFTSKQYEQGMELYANQPAELAKIKKKFTDLSDGFSFTDLMALRLLCRNEEFSINELPSAIDLYLYGIRENPWSKLSSGELDKAKALLKSRILGQDQVLDRVFSIIVRAKMGLAGLQHSSPTKPKGVLFFAGPTGTGKTETAKVLAQAIFGDERFITRFDMSEYRQDHSDQKLLGAPPGYVGYEAGGVLTNAVREKPFSVILFDEIEKAHPSILDKFLSILEDGRMTDGQGRTVSFSETLIIFTSNLGIYERTARDHIVPESRLHERVMLLDPERTVYSDVETSVRAAVEEFFKYELGRPELLNRIGENIFVFDFIRPMYTEQILKKQVKQIQDGLEASRGIKVSIEDKAHQQLLAAAQGNLINGARGIGNIVESHLLNPLSVYMWQNMIEANTTICVDAIVASGSTVTLVCRHRND